MIPSAVTDDEATKLAELARGGCILELGSHYGYSTIVMAQVARLVHSVDWHLGDSGTGLEDSLERMWANLTEHGVRRKVVLHVGRFEEVLPLFREEQFDGCFIDGDHRYEEVDRDLQLALPLVKPGGWVAFHDYGSNAGGGGVAPVAQRFGIHGSVCTLGWGFKGG